MTTRKIILMLVLLLGGVVYLWLVEGKKSEILTSDPVAKKESRLLAGLNVSDIKSISVVHSEDSYAVYHGLKEGSYQPKDSWRLKAPAGALADDLLVAKQLAALVALEVGNFVPPEEVLEAQEVYGLSPPQMLITIEGAFGKRILSFGKQNELSKRRYLQLEGDPRILLVEPQAFDLLLKKKDEIRLRQPTRFNPGLVNALVLIRDGLPSLVFKRKAKDQWVVISDDNRGVEIRADRALIERHLNDLASHVVAGFVDELAPTLAVYGLNRPDLVMQIYLDQEGAKGQKNADDLASEQLLIQVGKGIDLEGAVGGSIEGLQLSYYFKIGGEDQIYQMGKPTFYIWKQKLNYFRDRKPFMDLKLDDVISINFEPSGGKQQPSVTDKNFTEWFSVLRGVEVLSFVESGGLKSSVFGLDKPTAVITVAKRTVAKGGEGLRLKLSLGAQVANLKPGKNAPLSSSTVRQALLGEQSASDAPVYLSIDDGRESLVGVITAATAKSLFRDRSFFMQEQE